ncbi:MAG: threonine synthase [Nitrososphaeria archaeon]|nr:threonine synthase [Nitrososphaeria archaeon]NIQ33309.1 threonine synthase [Nitrososphaeria archaeon]
MGIIMGLRCKVCGKKFEGGLKFVCDKCWGPLEVDYDYDVISETLRKDDLKKRFFSLWRYLELLPIEDARNIVDLGDGGTPLHRCRRLGEEFGVKELYVKDDTVNPTLSFKDRPASVAVSKCREMGINTVGCASTGNLAAAVAAHASKAGLRCNILVPYNIEPSKILQTASFGTRIIGVHGTYDNANSLGILAAEHFGWGMVNINIRPFYVEGSKTLAYEVCEQLDWETPDTVIIPMASGALLSSIHRGFKELEKLGWINCNTRFVGSQPNGCSPIVNAFKINSEITPVDEPSTIAKSLAIGNPASGYEAIQVVKERKGTMDSPTDEEILKAMKLLAKFEGIFAEPAGAITLATFIRMHEDSEIDASEKVVLFVTGNGFKAPGTREKIIEKPVEIEPRLGALKNLVDSEET